MAPQISEQEAIFIGGGTHGQRKESELGASHNANVSLSNIICPPRSSYRIRRNTAPPPPAAPRLTRAHDITRLSCASAGSRTYLRTMALPKT